MASIAEILLAQGRQRANERRRKGELWGSAVSAIAEIPGNIYAQRIAEKQQQSQLDRQATLDARAEEAASERHQSFVNETEDRKAEIAKREAAQVAAQGYDAGLATATVQSWVKRGIVPADEGEQLTAQIQTPEGRKLWFDKIGGVTPPIPKAPEPFTLGEGQTRFGPEGQPLASVPKVLAPEKITFGAPQPLMVGGRKTIVRAGSDGKYYGPDAKELDPASIRPLPDREPVTTDRFMWAMGPDGKTKLMTPDEIRGAGAGQPETADMRNKEAGRSLVSKSINAIESLSRSIITKIGPAQRAEAIKRGAEAVFGTDPEFRTYQDARMALAGNLAVAQQGSRPSDADIKAIWLPLVPDAYRDTSESANLKWNLIKTMSNQPVDAPGIREAAASILQQNGKANDAAAIDQFLKNNPGWKP